MKILVVNSAEPEYMCDSIFHGLRSLFGESVVDFPKIEHMYNDAPPENEMVTYGRGFTMFRTLPNLSIDRTNILEKINSNFFDLIIWGSIRRNQSYLNICSIFKNNKCIAFDGEDREDFDWYVSTNIPYFKRELREISTSYLKPVGLSFPEEKIQNIISSKTQVNATVIPGFLDTYKFYNEKEYYEDYQKSLFAFTWKKAGWDCLRHHEIIFNNCIPIFLDLENCPVNTLTFLPKELLLEAKNLKGLKIISENNKPKIELDDMTFDMEKYSSLLRNIVNESKNKLTTKAMVSYVLNTI
jgi:hypothetical protein